MRAIKANKLAENGNTQGKYMNLKTVVKYST